MIKWEALSPSLAPLRLKSRRRTTISVIVEIGELIKTAAVRVSIFVRFHSISFTCLSMKYLIPASYLRKNVNAGCIKSCTVITISVHLRPAGRRQLNLLPKIIHQPLRRLRIAASLIDAHATSIPRSGCRHLPEPSWVVMNCVHLRPALVTAGG